MREDIKKLVEAFEFCGNCKPNELWVNDKKYSKDDELLKEITDEYNLKLIFENMTDDTEFFVRVEWRKLDEI